MANKYEEAGVDIQNGSKAVLSISKMVESTYDKNVISGIGGFGSEYSLSEINQTFDNPVLISSTDGVGTKLLLAIENNINDKIGIDLVAMCANDILAQGAKPLFFLDYLGVGNLKPDKIKEIISGIVEGCKDSHLSLIGGEMAEMPGIYQSDDYDLSGFAVGVAEKDRLIGADRVSEGDYLIGLPSSGVHSNGYSLVRKIIEDAQLDFNKKYDDLNQSLIDSLLEPTKLYFKTVYPLIERDLVSSIAHITGGGIEDNLSRSIPSNLTAEINRDQWKVPEIFNVLKKYGDLTQADVDQVFNQGIGMILVINQDNYQEVTNLFDLNKEDYYEIGKVVNNSNGKKVEFK
ncbi:phosphoribosylformylglycinamidine cyclo-ligase [Lactobacillus sp. S2-2]|uniref:phosphoribosylformylglycinamidine cyclo-ligase n=1 Tax=Lactobacillus sp. S2-2 TaxID=2692917 RepID=UPI001F02DE1A|nr:phosphoribosylformylglycinamidine cyclo-ligase [Lactobacillus sp. S2-2]MCF6515049.1 phosphoribosylformylglycinamidine cyclo-ligase [Lactobacillus sp. S2-2]